MKSLVPNQFLFRYAFACRRVRPTDDAMAELPEDCRIAFPGRMDGEKEFADLRIAWNEAGLAVSWEVRSKREPIYGEADRPKNCDGLSLWLDLRDTRTIHRASRYCCRFTLVAHNGKTPSAPEAFQFPIHRALADAPHADLSLIKFARFALDDEGSVLKTVRSGAIKSYRMEAFFPAAVLPGFDPETNSRLGICYRIRDREFGDQILASVAEMPYWEDPSLWSVLELVKTR